MLIRLVWTLRYLFAGCNGRSDKYESRDINFSSCAFHRRAGSVEQRDSYEKFPEQPELSTTGDVIDFYGPCNENPVGKDQVQTQRLEDQHRWEMEYTD